MTELYMIFSRKIKKNPEFYTTFARKYFFRDFFGGWGGGEGKPLAPVSYAYGWAPGLPPAKSGPVLHTISNKMWNKGDVDERRPTQPNMLWNGMTSWRTSLLVANDAKSYNSNKAKQASN